MWKELIIIKKIELQKLLRKREVGVICIQKAHLKEASRFSVHGYECVRHNRPTKAKGGIITIVKTSIKINQITSNLNTVKLVLDKDHLLITNCYNPPDTQ